MIRQRIRLLGRFLLRMRFKQEVKRAINLDAGLNKDSDIYKTSTVAFNLGMLLKQ